MRRPIAVRFFSRSLSPDTRSQKAVWRPLCVAGLPTRGWAHLTGTLEARKCLDWMPNCAIPQPLLYLYVA